MWGDPIEVASNASKEEMDAARLLAEETLNNMCHETDDLFGQDRIEPHTDEVAS